MHHFFSEHGLIKKVLLPFLLGLKFKASVLVPLALALIALKTWKALTLGLISLVLSGKFTKHEHILTKWYKMVSNTSGEMKIKLI